MDETLFVEQENVPRVGTPFGSGSRRLGIVGGIGVATIMRTLFKPCTILVGVSFRNFLYLVRRCIESALSSFHLFWIFSPSEYVAII